MNPFQLRFLFVVRLRPVAVAAALLLVCAACAFVGQASPPNTISKNTPGFIQKAADLGEADLGTIITATVWLELKNENLLDRLVQDQHTKGSPNYHKWISQEEFNATFSPTSQQVKAVQNFLSAHGLALLSVAENNFYVKVQGTVADMENKLLG